MHAKHPEIADRWEDHTPKGKKLPDHVEKKATIDGFFDELEKISNESPLRMANELAGLGVLAVPSLQHLRGKPMSDHHSHMMEIGGLGMLAAPYVHDLGAKAISGLRGLGGAAVKAAPHLGGI
jgi:hypothetical protein